LKSAKHRAELPACFPDPVVRTTIEADLQLCNVYDALIRDLEKKIEHEARDHQPTTLLLLRTIPGVGPILALTILYEIHCIERFARVQDFSSYCRLVKPEHSSAGNASAAAEGKSAMPISSGPSRKRLSASCTTTRAARLSSSGRASAMAMAKHSASWLRASGAPPTSCSSRTERSI